MEGEYERFLKNLDIKRKQIQIMEHKQNSVCATCSLTRPTIMGLSRSHFKLLQIHGVPVSINDGICCSCVKILHIFVSFINQAKASCEFLRVLKKRQFKTIKDASNRDTNSIPQASSKDKELYKNYYIKRYITTEEPESNKTVDEQNYTIAEDNNATTSENDINVTENIEPKEKEININEPGKEMLEKSNDHEETRPHIAFDKNNDDVLSNRIEEQDDNFRDDDVLNETDYSDTNMSEDNIDIPKWTDILDKNPKTSEKNKILETVLINPRDTYKSNSNTRQITHRESVQIATKEIEDIAIEISDEENEAFKDSDEHEIQDVISLIEQPDTADKITEKIDDLLKESKSTEKGSNDIDITQEKSDSVKVTAVVETISLNKSDVVDKNITKATEIPVYIFDPIQSQYRRYKIPKETNASKEINEAITTAKPQITKAAEDTVNINNSLPILRKKSENVSLQSQNLAKNVVIIRKPNIINKNNGKSIDEPTTNKTGIPATISPKNINETEKRDNENKPKNEVVIKKIHQSGNIIIWENIGSNDDIVTSNSDSNDIDDELREMANSVLDKEEKSNVISTDINDFLDEEDTEKTTQDYYCLDKISSQVTSKDLTVQEIIDKAVILPLQYNIDEKSATNDDTLKEVIVELHDRISTKDPMEKIRNDVSKAQGKKDNSPKQSDIHENTRSQKKKSFVKILPKTITVPKLQKINKSLTPPTVKRKSNKICRELSRSLSSLSLENNEFELDDCEPEILDEDIPQYQNLISEIYKNNKDTQARSEIHPDLGDTLKINMGVLQILVHNKDDNLLKESQTDKGEDSPKATNINKKTNELDSTHKESNTDQITGIAPKQSVETNTVIKQNVTPKHTPLTFIKILPKTTELNSNKVKHIDASRSIIRNVISNTQNNEGNDNVGSKTINALPHTEQVQDTANNPINKKNQLIINKVVSGDKVFKITPSMIKHFKNNRKVTVVGVNNTSKPASNKITNVNDEYGMPFRMDPLEVPVRANIIIKGSANPKDVQLAKLYLLNKEKEENVKHLQVSQYKTNPAKENKIEDVPITVIKFPDINPHLLKNVSNTSPPKLIKIANKKYIDVKVTNPAIKKNTNTSNMDELNQNKIIADTNTKTNRQIQCFKNITDNINACKRDLQNKNNTGGQNINVKDVTDQEGFINDGATVPLPSNVKIENADSPTTILNDSVLSADLDQFHHFYNRNYMHDSNDQGINYDDEELSNDPPLRYESDDNDDDDQPIYKEPELLKEIYSEYITEEQLWQNQITMSDGYYKHCKRKKRKERSDRVTERKRIKSHSKEEKKSEEKESTKDPYIDVKLLLRPIVPLVRIDEMLKFDVTEFTSINTKETFKTITKPNETPKEDTNSSLLKTIENSPETSKSVENFSILAETPSILEESELIAEDEQNPKTPTTICLFCFRTKCICYDSSKDNHAKQIETPFLSKTSSILLTPNTTLISDSETPEMTTEIKVEVKIETAFELPPRKERRKRMKTMKPVRKFKARNSKKYAGINIETDKEYIEIMERIKNQDDYKMAEFKCPSCVMCFANKRALYLHCFHRHRENNGPITCHLCNCRFSHKVELVTHLREHKRYYQCKLCQDLFVYSYMLLHYKNRHQTEEEKTLLKKKKAENKQRLIIERLNKKKKRKEELKLKKLMNLNSNNN